MIKKIIWFPALLATLFVSQVSVAHSSHGQQAGGFCYHHCMHDALQHISLTTEQKAKIKALKESIKAELAAKSQEMQPIHTQITAVIKMENLDKAKLDALIDQKKEIIASIIKAKILVKNQVYNLLDAKQKAKLDAMMDKCEQAEMEKMKKENDSD